MKASLLQVTGVAKAYGPRLLFRHVNMSVEAGVISLLVGSNGAGKSTLMRIMAGLLRPDAGKRDMSIAPEKLGYLGHSTLLYPALTARENLLFWARAMGLTTTKADAENRAEAALEAVGLIRHAHDRAGVFSRGMMQRLNLARLLQAEPEVLLLDEPGTGLDVGARDLLRSMVRAARERGAGVVWISHDLEEDAPWADRVFRLEKRSLHRADIPLPQEKATSPKGALLC